MDPILRTIAMVDRDIDISAVLAEPHSESVRQVYADSLLERGNPRGEFISLQLAAARGSRDSQAGQRESVLLSRYSQQWMFHPEWWHLRWKQGFADTLEAGFLEPSASLNPATTDFLRSHGVLNERDKWEGCFLENFFSLVEARLLTSAHIVLTDFIQSAAALVNAMGANGPLRLSRLTVESRYARLGPQSTAVSSTFQGLAFPSPGTQGWPLVSSSALSRFSKATPFLSELRLALPGFLSSFQHAQLQRLKIYGHRTISDSDNNIVIDARSLRSLELTIDTPIDESPVLPVESLVLDPDRLPRLQELALCGGEYVTSEKTVARWVAGQPILRQLRVLWIPEISDQDDAASLGQRFRHLDRIVVQRVGQPRSLLEQHLPQLRVLPQVACWTPS